MGFCLATFLSGNYAMNMHYIMKRQGDYGGEVQATPCRISNAGCGYCIKLPCELVERLKRYAAENNIKIVSVYRVEQQNTRNKYTQI